MKLSKVLFFGGLAAGAYWLIMRYSAGIGVEWTGIKWMGLDGLKMRLALKYRLINSNDVPCTVSNFKGKLYYGEYKVNDVDIPKAVTVQPGQSEALEVLFTISPGFLLAEILKYIDDRSGFKKFRLAGIMTGKIGDVPWLYPVNETLSLAE